MTTTDLPRGILPLTAAGRRFARDIGDPATQYMGVLEAGQAAELVLDAIARSDGTRASVLKELQASEVRDGILGSFHFDRNGDISAAAIPVLRITGTTPPGTRPAAGLPGSGPRPARAGAGEPRGMSLHTSDTGILRGPPPGLV